MQIYSSVATDTIINSYCVIKKAQHRSETTFLFSSVLIFNSHFHTGRLHNQSPIEEAEETHVRGGSMPRQELIRPIQTTETRDTYLAN